jgi:hypothetical protein
MTKLDIALIKLIHQHLALSQEITEKEMDTATTLNGNPYKDECNRCYTYTTISGTRTQPYIQYNCMDCPYSFVTADSITFALTYGRGDSCQGEFQREVQKQTTTHLKSRKTKAKDKYNHRFNSFWRSGKNSRYF